MKWTAKLLGCVPHSTTREKKKNNRHRQKQDVCCCVELSVEQLLPRFKAGTGRVGIFAHFHDDNFKREARKERKIISSTLAAIPLSLFGQFLRTDDDKWENFLMMIQQQRQGLLVKDEKVFSFFFIFAFCFATFRCFSRTSERESRLLLLLNPVTFSTPTT